MRPVGDTSISNKFFEACASNFPGNRKREGVHNASGFIFYVYMHWTRVVCVRTIWSGF